MEFFLFKRHQWRNKMNRELALEFSRVTEAAALAGYQWVGRGDKNKSDHAAVFAMRTTLNKININGEIVIGEGEIDEAPMLYIGERVGNGVGAEVDIAVDPIDGTRMTALGQNNALAVIAVGEKGSFLKAPDMYMEKLIVGSDAKGVIDLNLPIIDNMKNIAKKLNKPLNKLTVITLAKPRHEQMIKEMQQEGIRVYAIPDGDVAASVLTCLPNNEIDVLYCIGGAPEGVISGSVVRALGGDMNARLLLRNDVKGDTQENQYIAKIELKRCHDMQVEPGMVLTLDQIVKTDNVIFSATGITKGDLLDGITRYNDKHAETETLLIRGKTGTIRRIRSTHILNRKDPDLLDIIL